MENDGLEKLGIFYPTAYLANLVLASVRKVIKGS